MVIKPGKLDRDILRLAIPNVISNLTVPLLGMADFALMGHLRADSAIYVGAIALGTTVFNVLYMSFGFLRMGTSGFTAQATGAHDEKEISLGLQRSLLVAFSFAILLILFQYPIQWVAFHLLNGEPDVKVLARQYFYIRIYAAPATLALYSFYGWYLGMQNAKIPMLIVLIVNVVNIGMNFFLVFVMKMTSNGVALANVIAQYSGLLVAFIFLFKKYRHHVRWWKAVELFQKSALMRFFSVNTDIFIRTLVLILMLSFFTSESARLGNNILAANSLLFQFFFLFSYFADGFAFAGEALSGKAKGAQDLPELRKTVQHLFKWGFAIAILTSLIFFSGITVLMKIMTSNIQIMDVSRNYYFWIVILPLTSTAAFIWDGIYVGVTASKAMRNTMIISAFVIFLPTYYGTVHTIGNNGLWLALELFMIARGIT
ncbi:MAG: MATE family efflux transporter, partial [Bacteroidales bacterium]|nr:MATE family efflux transporter [Bacteroidales bacterium]